MAWETSCGWIVIVADPADLRFGMNRGRPSTVIPKTVKPSHKKGKKT
jgi:large subunit ribosomal protein L36e